MKHIRRWLEYCAEEIVDVALISWGLDMHAWRLGAPSSGRRLDNQTVGRAVSNVSSLVLLAVSDGRRLAIVTEASANADALEVTMPRRQAVRIDRTTAHSPKQQLDIGEWLSES